MIRAETLSPSRRGRRAWSAGGRSTSVGLRSVDRCASTAMSTRMGSSLVEGIPPSFRRRPAGLDRIGASRAALRLKCECLRLLDWTICAL